MKDPGSDARWDCNSFAPMPFFKHAFTSPTSLPWSIELPLEPPLALLADFFFFSGSVVESMTISAVAALSCSWIHPGRAARWECNSSAPTPFFKLAFTSRASLSFTSPPFSEPSLALLAEAGNAGVQLDL
ncbi:hypothetical protein Lal_00017644 [Lupinus albus]|nr:hypothetical protein Lal_00017644 [Lupinus albus]